MQQARTPIGTATAYGPGMSAEERMQAQAQAPLVSDSRSRNPYHPKAHAQHAQQQPSIFALEQARNAAAAASAAHTAGPDPMLIEIKNALGAVTKLLINMDQKLSSMATPAESDRKELESQLTEISGVVAPIASKISECVGGEEVTKEEVTKEEVTKKRSRSRSRERSRSRDRSGSRERSSSPKRRRHSRSRS